MSRKGSISATIRGAVGGWLLGVCGLLTLAADMGIASAQASAKRYSITNGAILAAMQQRQLPVIGVQIRLAAPITASVAGPELDIHSLTMGDKHSAQLLVGCRNPGECLPFYVSASWPVEVDVASLRGNLPDSTDALRDGAKRNFSEDARAFRAGSPATLLLDGERVHVTLRVVCLESGQPGEKVRVTTPDRRQEYVVSVVSPGVLKGTF